MKLVLERKSQDDSSGRVSERVLITPAIGADYWSYRVDVGGGQAVLGFPKFGTIGVGFAVEDDWNTNLPYRCETDEIFEHIKHNRKPSTASDDEIKQAIELICEAAATDTGVERGLHR